MKNKPHKPLKPSKNKQKAIALVLGLALALCSIIAPFTAYNANADVVENDDVLISASPQEYFHHPLASFSISCSSNTIQNSIEVFDCPDTYGGNVTAFSHRSSFTYYFAWQNTNNATFHVERKEPVSVTSDDVVFQLFGTNVATVREHIGKIGWTIGTGQIRYKINVKFYPVLSAGTDGGEFINYNVIPAYWYNGQYKFYWTEIFESVPDYVLSDNGTALFDVIWISFIPLSDYDNVTTVFAFADEGSDTDITVWDYAIRINSLYHWIYNGSPVETILSFPIDFLKTEIFPDFSFGMLLLIALGFILFGFALKIALGG